MTATCPSLRVCNDFYYRYQLKTDPFVMGFSRHNVHARYVTDARILFVYRGSISGFSLVVDKSWIKETVLGKLTWPAGKRHCDEVSCF
jgi:hypothetical protein